MKAIGKFVSFFLLSILLCACDKPEDEIEASKLTEKDGSELSSGDILNPVVGKTVNYPDPLGSYSTFALPEELKNLTMYNYPIMDGSESTQPLRRLLWCRFLRIEPDKWINPTLGYYTIYPDYGRGESEELRNQFWRANWDMNTHQSFLNLIDDEVDIIITARGISRDEKVYADEQGVELIEKPIAKDAFVFMVNVNNPVGNLTIHQIQDIYTANLRNWKEVGGKDAEISPYIRNANSGSQEKMETIVMKGLTMIDWPEMKGMSMGSPYLSIDCDEYGIAYTPYYYYRYMARDPYCRVIGVEGIAPTRETITNGTYPFVTEVVTAIRADEPHDSYTYRIFEILTQGRANSIIKESGYIPYK
ncbi:MAG: substrate-binding domain-containing protein [Bacteroidaceae bacterium]|nr:substrate-binding domain-containing protein [Bacteroidaceae bacterium]MBQ9882929.1 substrate-binding domain-containing protein [Bacteroidaceae bacterium]